MKLFILSIISLFLSVTFAMGQTIQNVIGKLVKHQLLDESNKDEMKQFLKRQGDTSNKIILAGLHYFEMMKIAENNNFSNIVALPELTKEQQDSTNRQFLKYLTSINSAGLISPSIYSECRSNIEQSNYQIKYQLIEDLSQKTLSLELFGQTMLPIEKKNPISIKEIEDAVNNWKNIGLLNHLTKEQIEFSKSKAIEDSSENLNEVLLHFPSVIHFFDTELENLKDPYAELLTEFSKISHGLFNPTRISDNFNSPTKNKITVKFTLNGKNYSKELSVEDDWIDASFIAFVKQVVTENKLNGQFYELHEGGQGAYIIFLAAQQLEFTKQEKLLVFPED